MQEPECFFFTIMEYLNSKHVDLCIMWISTLLLLSYNIYKLYVCRIEYSKLKVKIVKYLVSNSHKILMWPALRRLARSLGVGTMTRPNTKKIHMQQGFTSLRIVILLTCVPRNCPSLSAMWWSIHVYRNLCKNAKSFSHVMIQFFKIIYE